jgi:transposase InsO family protein
VSTCCAAPSPERRGAAGIKAIHAQTRGAYGWPRVWRELTARAVPVGKERVQKLMQLHGIRAKGKRRFKVTTDSLHGLAISPNLLDRKFTVAEPDKVWVGDITYIATDEGWLLVLLVNSLSLDRTCQSLRTEQSLIFIINLSLFNQTHARNSNHEQKTAHRHRRCRYFRAVHCVVAESSARGDPV